MKKTLSIFGLLVGCCLLASCTTTPSSSTTSNTDTFVSYWGDETVEKAIESSIQYDIPFFDAPSYDAVAGVDEVNDPTLEIYFMGYEEAEVIKKCDAYASVCKANGYEINFTTNYYEGGSYDVYYADKAISDLKGIEIQILAGTHNGEYCFAAFATTYILVEPSSFPNQLIQYYLGYEIPFIEDDRFTYEGQVGYEEGIYVYIEAQNAVNEDEETYLNLLISEHYLIDDSQYDEYGYFAMNEAQTYIVQFKFAYNALCIYTWAINF